MVGVLIQIDGWDPVANAAISLRAASHDDSRVCHLGGQTWWPAIAQLPTLKYDLFDGAFGEAITAPSSSMTITTEPWPDMPRWALADARFRLWTGEVGDPFPDWTLRCDGRVTEQPQIANAIASLSFAVDDRWLDVPLLDLYEGTTGVEGEAALKGTPKPLSLGAPRYVPGVLINSVDTILQLSAYGVMQDVEAALERLSRFSASFGNYASYAALQATAIPAGRWATSLAKGLVRHGAPLNGQSSYMVQGDAVGGWSRLPGAIIARIAAIADAADRVSSSSLAALDAARPWPLSLWIAEQTTPRELIQRIAASVNAVAGVSWLGDLFVVPIGVGMPAMTLRSDGSELPPVGDVAQIAVGQPFWRIALQAERTWAVHALGDVAFTAELIERGTYDASESYREGHIVSVVDGSRWLYVNTTPASGHAPPDPPATSDAYWDRLQAPIDLSGLTDAIADIEAALQRVTSDAYLSMAEKPQTIIDWNAITADLNSLDDRYDALGAPADITEARDDAVAAITALGTYLTSLDPAWNDVTQDTPIAPLDYRLAWTSAYVAIAVFRAATTGRPGPQGDPGADALSFVLSATNVVIDATYVGVPKLGELPVTLTASVSDSLGTVAATFTVDATSGCDASVTGSVISIDSVIASGWVDVKASAGTFEQVQRVTITRLDDPPPAQQGLASQTTNMMGAAGLLTTYAATPPYILTVAADGDGAVVMNFYGTYRVPVPESLTTRTLELRAKAGYRIAGSGAAWSDVDTEATGTVASSRRYEIAPGEPDVEREPGTIAQSATLSGLTAGEAYEFGFFARRSGGTYAYDVTIYGGLTVRQPDA